MRTTLVSFDGAERLDSDLVEPGDRGRLLEGMRGEGPVIARGAGLNYCMASGQAGGRTISALGLDRVLEFDQTSGRTRVEAGIRLGALYRATVPHGWVLPIMPGHPSISVGGCIACDVHGKNHRREGTFGNAVLGLTVLHPDHGEVRCSRDENREVFEMTVGGFGLTGLIVAAELRLKPTRGAAGMVVATHAVASLGEAVALMEQHPDADALYSWHDFNRRGRGFGQGFVFVGRPHDSAPEPELAWKELVAERRGQCVPSALARLGVRAATTAYELWQRIGSKPAEVALGAATFPIRGKEVYFDLYGKRGFREYQLLVERERWPECATRIEASVRARRACIGLASLKLFGGTASRLRFDGSGVCLAIDVVRDAEGEALFADLDRAVLEARGIVNIAKDSRLTAALARQVFPEYESFRTRLMAYDPRRRMGSALRQRLEL